MKKHRAETFEFQFGTQSEEAKEVIDLFDQVGGLKDRVQGNLVLAR